MTSPTVARVLRVSLLPLALAVMLPLAGCASDPRQGYSFQSSFRTDVQTVAVSVFENRTYTPGIENDLAQALVAEIHRTTPYRVAAENAAQTRLQGAIVSADLRRLSVGRTSGLAEDMALQLTVEFAWTDAKTGKSLVARRNFAVAENFIPAQGVGDRLAVGQNAAVSQLAKDIVAELRSGW
ncbi:MAG: LPS assembly lipoprotein LptE [Planctomycetaceae bacterium]|nr:LPS assembly lipoprotein LptE [Planctomycetaceae bacterium]